MNDQSDKTENTADGVPHAVSARLRRKDRVFKRSRAARARREAQDKKDFRLVVILLQVSVLGALVLAAVGVAGHRAVHDPGSAGQGAIFLMAEPVFMGLSMIEIAAGILFVAVVAALLWRGRKKR